MSSKALRNGIIPTENFELLTWNVRQILASGYFPTDNEEDWNTYLEDTHGGDRFLGSIVYPTIDVELNAYTWNGSEPYEAKGNDNEIVLAYFVCTKGLSPYGRDEWESDDFIPYEVDVDFTDPNWQTMLEADMLEKLDKYVEEHGLSYTELNF